MADNLVGRVLGDDFELRSLLARGGQAAVYRAYSRSRNAEVAVKVLASRFAAGADFRERFLEEFRSLAQLHHENLIEVYRYGVEDDLVYIAMRLVPGGTLTDRLSVMEGPVDLVTTARIISQVSAALQHAHDHGLVHLDIKPSNILLGRADWPLLADFGITRAVAKQETEHGSVRVAGTPLFMSPEQCAGGPVDGRSDQYSLAVTAFEMLTGQLPFQATTTEQLLDLHVNQPPPRPRDVNPGLPGPVEDVLLRALAKNPDDRYPTIDAFGESLRRVVAETHGVSLETKAAVAAITPNLVGFLALVILSPVVLASIPRIGILGGRISLSWPCEVFLSILLVALLLPARWHFVGLLARGIGALVDAARPEAATSANSAATNWPRWRKRLIGTAEGFVNLGYILAVYQLVLAPLAELSRAFLPSTLAPWSPAITLALASLVTLLVVVGLARTAGPFVAAGFALILLAFGTASLPVLSLSAGPVSVALVVALAAALFLILAWRRIRSGSNRLALGVMGPLLISGGVHQDQADKTELRRRAVRPIGAAVDLLLVVIVLLLLHSGLSSLTGQRPEVLVFYRGAAFLIWLVLSLRLLAVGGWPWLAFAIIVGAPLTTLLPDSFVSGGAGIAALGSSSPRDVTTWAFAIVIFLLLVASRSVLRNNVARPLATWAERQLVGPVDSPNEEAGERRTQAIVGLLQAICDVVVLCIGYWFCGPPLIAALAYRTGSPWILGGILVTFTLLVAGILASALFQTRNILVTTGAADWGRGGALPFLALGTAAVIVSGGVAIPTIVANPEVAGLAILAPAPPHLVVSWQYWQPDTPGASEATYNLALNCSNGEQFGEFREVFRPASGALPSGTIATPTLPVTNCSAWRDVYFALRRSAGLTAVSSLSRAWLDEQVTLNRDGSADVVDTERVLFTAGVFTNLNWQIPAEPGEQIEGVTLREGDQVYPFDSNSTLVSDVPRSARLAALASDPSDPLLSWSFPPIESPAERTYTISYHIVGALHPVAGGQEFRRQVVAPRVSGPVWRATVDIHLPTGVGSGAVALQSIGAATRHQLLDRQTAWFEATDIGNRGNLDIVLKFAGPSSASTSTPTNTPTPTPATAPIAAVSTSAATTTPTATSVATQAVTPSPTSSPTSSPMSTASPTSTPTPAVTLTTTPTSTVPPTQSPRTTPAATSSATGSTGAGSVGTVAAVCGKAPVLAMYYNWYDQNSWNSTLSDQPTAPYVSADRATIMRQVTQAQSVGIDGFEVNWWGPGNQTDTNLQTLLTIAGSRGFKVTIDFDMNSPFVKNSGDLASDLSYLSRYYNDPAWFHYGGKPFIAFYGVTKYSVQTWAGVRKQVDPNNQVVWMGEGDQFQYLSVFDGIHPYSIAWSPNPAAQLASYAQKTRAYPGKIWMATAMPGYNDVGVNGSKGFAVNRNNGGFYKITWNGATATNPDIINITSFNEWTEGSMIEPSRTYGDLYLNLTKQLVGAYRSGAGC